MRQNLEKTMVWMKKPLRQMNKLNKMRISNKLNLKHVWVNYYDFNYYKTNKDFT